MKNKEILTVLIDCLKMTILGHYCPVFLKAREAEKWGYDSDIFIDGICAQADQVRIRTRKDGNDHFQLFQISSIDVDRLPFGIGSEVQLTIGKGSEGYVPDPLPWKVESFKMETGLWIYDIRRNPYFKTDDDNDGGEWQVGEQDILKYDEKTVKRELMDYLELDSVRWIPSEHKTEYKKGDKWHEMPAGYLMPDLEADDEQYWDYLTLIGHYPED